MRLEDGVDLSSDVPAGGVGVREESDVGRIGLGSFI